MNLNQITVPTIDLEKSIAFYTTLGLKLIVQSTPRYARFECPEGNATFSIHLVETLPIGHGISVYFECQDLDQKVMALLGKGVKFDDMPEDKSWLWREAHLRDPDDNHIILYFAGENRLNPPWRIKS